jgi:hypothetical protein
MRRLAVFALLGSLGCGSRPQAAPAPQSINDTVTQFLAAVKANDLERMEALWGDARGPASSRWKATELRQRVTVIQLYLRNAGYRILEGPLPVAGREDVRSFRVELQREQCNVVATIDVVRSERGGWFVLDPHLETLPNPARRCGPAGSGTGP